MRDRTVILGIGNILLSDEGVGVRIVEELKKLDLPKKVEIYDGATLGLPLLNFLDGCKKAVIVDAVLGGGKPGEVYRFSLYDVLEKSESKQDLKNIVSMHDIDFVTAFKIGKDFLNLPEEIIVIGVEPASFEEGLELSEDVKRAIPKAIEMILKEINEG